ncbi:hypothetical protein RCL1_005625 [Eukaryota sp. TZLM3-RCL]
MDPESISGFLLEYSGFKDNAGAEIVPSMRDCTDGCLLEGLALVEPKVLKSDAELRKFLEARLSFSSVEEAYLALKAISIINSIHQIQARMFDYLQRFLVLRKQVAQFHFPDQRMLVSFARGLYPKGLVDSLVSRIEDGIISSLTDLFEISLDELTDLDRVRLWKQPLPVSSFAGEKGELMIVISLLLATSLLPQLSSPDPKTFLKDFVFKCHKPGHIASACRDTKSRISVSVIYSSSHF